MASLMQPMTRPSRSRIFGSIARSEGIAMASSCRCVRTCEAAPDRFTSQRGPMSWVPYKGLRRIEPRCMRGCGMRKCGPVCGGGNPADGTEPILIRQLFQIARQLAPPIRMLIDGPRHVDLILNAERVLERDDQHARGRRREAAENYEKIDLLQGAHAEQTAQL